MGRIVVSDNVSLDGVVQDPAGDEGFERLQRWLEDEVDISFEAVNRWAKASAQEDLLELGAMIREDRYGGVEMLPTVMLTAYYLGFIVGIRIERDRVTA